MKHLYKFILIVALFIPLIAYSQVELVPVSNKVYEFLDRMAVNKIITQYSPSMKPISRREIAGYLTEIKSSGKKLSAADKQFLNDYFVAFHFGENNVFERCFSIQKDCEFTHVPFLQNKWERQLCYKVFPRF